CDAVNKYKTEGYTILAIEQAEGSTMLQNITIDSNKKYAVILGNEVKGVDQNAINLCDGCIELPQFGTKHSLNVSITAGIIIWEFAKKLLL
ncbi:MAG: TrmH family RNA methyltransferase, partial [Paludibacteraceae bacterium]|nr:TrmH family RNA methyltransferase [Paludibacteraceae bacterium]